MESSSLVTCENLQAFTQLRNVCLTTDFPQNSIAKMCLFCTFEMIQNLMKLLTICITLVTLAPTLEKGLIDNDSSLCVSFLGIYSQSCFCKTMMPTIVVPFAQKRQRCESVCSPMVKRASVAHDVPGSIPHRSEYYGI